MNEESKKVFLQHFSALKMAFEILPLAEKMFAAATMHEIVDIYADICGITYEEAVDEIRASLEGQDGSDSERT